MKAAPPWPITEPKTRSTPSPTHVISLASLHTHTHTHTHTRTAGGQADKCSAAGGLTAVGRAHYAPSQKINQSNIDMTRRYMRAADSITAESPPPPPPQTPTHTNGRIQFVPVLTDRASGPRVGSNFHLVSHRRRWVKKNTNAFKR